MLTRVNRTIGAILLAVAVGCQPAGDAPESGEPQAGADSQAEAPVVGADCAATFEEAAAVSDFQNTHEDLFPAYSACRDLDEWRAVAEMHPGAIRRVDPVVYARNVCAGNQDRLGGSAICLAANELSEPETTVEALSPSGKSGLLGAPIPEGAELVESHPGDPETMRDPREVYSIAATAEEIRLFFQRGMTGEGWSLRGSSTDTMILFVRGDLMLGVIINEEEGRFTLMGS